MDASRTPCRRGANPLDGVALALGGGGPAGIAWECGLLLGLRDEGVDLAGCGLVIGTSAGAVVGAQLLSQRGLEPAQADHLDPTSTTEPPIAASLELIQRRLTDLRAQEIPADELRRRIGSFAVEATDPTLRRGRRAQIRTRLGGEDWPDADLRVTAIDVATGALVMLASHSHVHLADAVEASCAVPGIWPVVNLDGKTLIDGGMRSGTNHDLAGDRPTIVVEAMQIYTCSDVPPDPGPRWRIRPSEEVRSVQSDGDRFNPAKRAASAETGRRQGRAEAAGLRDWLKGVLPLSV